MCYYFYINFEQYCIAYNQLENFGFEHETVNHKSQFIGPNIGAITYCVEAVAKIQIKEIHEPTNPDIMDDYFAESIWSQIQ